LKIPKGFLKRRQSKKKRQYKAKRKEKTKLKKYKQTKPKNNNNKTMMYKIVHRTLKNEQHEPTKNWG